jgi:hypothetical protein
MDVCFHLVMNLYGIDSVFTIGRSKNECTTNENGIHISPKIECINEYIQSSSHG